MSDECNGLQSESLLIFRRRWCGLIWSVSRDLGFDTISAASAALYFQRFYVAEKEEEFDARRIAISSLWLASKVREGGCRLRDIVNSFEIFLGRRGDEKGMSMEAYWTLRDELVLHEQALLRAMAFDAELTPAYAFLTEFAWMLGAVPANQGVLSLAWTLLNDAFCSEVCVMSAPERLSLGCLVLAIEMSSRVPELQKQAAHLATKLDQLLREPLLEDFLGLGPHSGAEEIEDVCRDLLAVYQAEFVPRVLASSADPAISDSDL
eukprot:TRINITY_DN64438_c0_g1_i1.p1 TRINITY_DN64438_c0_g1~~TRINITY_DN64438_c0_g1_i1.p1  ORF type:complete len:264 (-),score=38.93 TRINITY_DN64438_c0_g1_i1:15-806(-)